MVYSPDREARKLVQPPSTGRAMLVSDGRRTVLSGSRMLIGRSKEADVVIDDPNVSRRHAELRHQDGAWIVADLGSTNGMKVNGRRVEHAVLKPGDEIMLGLVRLSFEQE
jgi:pSer/pThr/pTyr-binding forkhead associated (FHA) protein